MIVHGVLWKIMKIWISLSILYKYLWPTESIIKKIIWPNGIIKDRANVQTRMYIVAICVQYLFWDDNEKCLVGFVVSVTVGECKISHLKYSDNIFLVASNMRSFNVW